METREEGRFCLLEIRNHNTLIVVIIAKKSSRKRFSLLLGFSACTILPMFLLKFSIMKKKLLLLAGILIIINLFVFGAYYFSTYKSKQSSSVDVSLKERPNRKASPTPFPFQEMTIPYLRLRTYQSSLGEMRQVSQNGNYTSYLTNYDSDGLKVYGQLAVPSGEKPKAGWPAIVFVHGYIPPKNYQTLENYSAYVDYLANNNFVVFKIDLRGHGNSEGEPGGGYYSADYIIDTLNARAALQTSDFVNPDAVGLWGHSMAGNVIARALAAQPEIPAIVIWAGAVYTYEDFSQFSIQDNSYQPPPSDAHSRKKRNELFEKYGQFGPESAFWKQVPMTNYLSDIKGAISLNHAVDDYSSGGHNLTGSAFNEAMQNTVEFFKENL